MWAERVRDGGARGAPRWRCAGGDACGGSVRLVRVEAFEPAVYVAPEHRDAYERRFVTLLVDEASRRRGGVGEVLHARNPRGERFALKRLRRSDGEGGDDELAEARRAAFDAEYDAIAPCPRCAASPASTDAAASVRIRSS